MLYEGEEALTFFKMLHDINQDFKTIPENDKHYFINRGLIFSCGSLQFDKVYGEILPYRQYKDFAEALSDSTDIIMIDHNKLFQFQKDYKKNVNMIEIKDNVITIGTDIPGLELRFDANLVKYDFDKSVKVIKNIKKTIKDQEPWKFDFTYEMFQELKDARTVSSMYLNTESQTISIGEPTEEYYVPMRFNNKYLIKMTKTSKCNISLFESEDDEKVFIVQVTIDNKKYKSHQYFKVVDF